MNLASLQLGINEPEWLEYLKVVILFLGILGMTPLSSPLNGPLVIAIPLIHLCYDKMAFHFVISKPTIECDK